jgi:hypothetical protein
MLNRRNGGFDKLFILDTAIVKKFVLAPCIFIFIDEVVLILRLFHPYFFFEITFVLFCFVT